MIVGRDRTMIRLARGTYLQPEEYAYPAGGQTRRGRAAS